LFVIDNIYYNVVIQHIGAGAMVIASFQQTLWTVQPVSSGLVRQKSVGEFTFHDRVSHLTSVTPSRRRMGRAVGGRTSGYTARWPLRHAAFSDNTDYRLSQENETFSSVKCIERYL